jgi:DNA-binding response OmpR family regulator
MRVLIVDDDHANRKMVTYLMGEEGYHVESAASGQEALRLLDERVVDLVILDVMMPGMDGYELLTRLKQRFDLPVIFLSAKGETADRVKGLDTGADDYLAKPFEPAELMARVRSVMRRAEIFSKGESNSAVHVGQFRLDPTNNRIHFGEGRHEDLTPIEYRMIHALMRNVGRTQTHDMLLNAVWGYEYEGYSNQIAVYIRRLRAKIEPVPSEPIHLVTVRGLGYKFQLRDELEALE